VLELKGCVFGIGGETDPSDLASFLMPACKKALDKAELVIYIFKFSFAVWGGEVCRFSNFAFSPVFMLA